jgi:hypothetical protein
MNDQEIKNLLEVLSANGILLIDTGSDIVNCTVETHKHGEKVCFVLVEKD